MTDDLKARLCRGEWRALLDPELPLLLVVDAGDWWAGGRKKLGAWNACVASLIHDTKGLGSMLPAYRRQACLDLLAWVGARLAGSGKDEKRAALAILRTYLPVSS